MQSPSTATCAAPTWRRPAAELHPKQAAQLDAALAEASAWQAELLRHARGVQRYLHWSYADLCDEALRIPERLRALATVDGAGEFDAARLVDVAERVFGIEVRGKGKTKQARLEARVARVLDAAYWRRTLRRRIAQETELLELKLGRVGRNGSAYCSAQAQHLRATQRQAQQRWLDETVLPAEATAAKEKTPSSLAAEPASPVVTVPPAPMLPTVAAPAAVPHEVHVDTDASIEVDGDVLRLVCGARTWAVRGVPKVHPGASLKLNVRVQQASDAVRPVAALHVDSVDLYSARSRAVFAAQAAAELGGRDAEALQRELLRELGRVLLAVERAIEQREREASAPKQVAPTMTDAEHEAALAWLKAPNLLQRIAADFDACGLVGEPTNKLTAYLACVSRLLASPLAVLVQSSSAAGKTSLMDAVLAFMPEEARIRYSAMTGQSLYYMGQTDLKHRILALAEEEGAARASYALKLLQSDGELTMAATGKDPQSGALVTQEYHVEGPVMLMLTTTAIDIDEELMNRCLVLTVDEGRQQTEAIHARQRERRTLAGLLARQNKHDIHARHRHAQRLLKPLAVVNPYAEQLSFHARHARARRDHEKYLTLIDAIALLHQHQRPVRTAQAGGQAIEYIEVTREDIEAAHVLANDVLGRSLDELPPVTRKLLRAVSGYVAERAAARGVPVEDVRFTRRELREACGWGDTQLRLHLERLAALELVASERSGRGGQVHYWLQVAGGDAGDGGVTRLCGLVNPAQLVEATTPKSRGAGGEVAGLQVEVAAMSRGDETTPKRASMRVGGKVAGDAAPSDRVEAVNGRSYTTPQVAATA